MSRKNKLRLAASCAAALFISQSAHATDYKWIGTGSTGNWTDTTNWDQNNGNFPGASDTATFNAAGNNVAETISLNGNQSATSVTFANTLTTALSGNTLALSGGITTNSGAGTATISSSISLLGSQSFINNATTNTLNTDPSTLTIGGTISSAAGTQVLTLDGTGKGLITGVIANGSGTTALVKNGTGTWEIDNNSDTFTGGLTVNSGIVTLKGSNALGNTGTHSLTINGGAVGALDAARSIPATVSVAIFGDCTLGTSTTDGHGNQLNFAGTLNLEGGVRNITFKNSAAWTGVVSNGGFTITAASTPSISLSLQNTGNSYSGPTTVLAGSLTIGSGTIGGDCFPTTSALTLASGATFNANNTGTMPIASLSDYQNAGGTIFMGNGGGDNMSIGSDNTTTTFSGIFTGTDTAGTGGVTKVGTGTLKLAGTSTFNGYTAVANGTLAFTTVTNVGSASSLLNPSTAALATIALGATTTTGTLQYVGSMSGGASSDRVINLAGTTGGGTIDASGSTTITFTSNLTATGVGAKTLTLTGSNTGANTLAGVIPDNSAGNATSVAKTGVGTWVLTGTNTYTGDTSVANGKLTLNTNLLTSTSVTVTGGTLELGALQTRVIQTPTVSVTGTGKLDVQDNKMIVSTTPIGTATGGVYTSGSVQGMVQSGRGASGNWSGVGIVTSQATAMGTTALTTLGVDVASDVTGVSSGTTLWAGQTVNPTDTLVKYTYAGDANLSGSIDGDDYFKIDHGFANNLSGYANGDFNYDGVVNADDYFIIDKNYVQQTTAFPSAAPLNLSGGLSAVPEPASLALLGLSAAGLFGRRRRNR